MIAVTHSQVPELESLGFPHDRIRVVPYGVLRPVEAIAGRATTRRALELPADAFVAAIVARISPEKRIDRFIEAIALLQERHPNVLGLVVGDGPDAHDIQQMARRINARVQFVGYQADPAVWMRAADVVCLTSEREGLPLSLLEAAACERPCLVMDIGGVRDVIRDQWNGLVVRAGDVTAFAEALALLAQDPDRAVKMGKSAQQRWTAEFSIDAMADRYFDLLTTLSGPPARWPS